MADVTADMSLVPSATGIGLPINDGVGRSRLYLLGKLAQTILLRPVTTSATFLYRTVRLLTWVPIKAGAYKVSGYHTESSAFFETEYLKTVKALRNLLFIPSIAKRAFQDLVARRAIFRDDIPSMPTEAYLKVTYTRNFQQYSSYLHGVKTVDVIKPEGITEFAAVSDASLQTVMGSHLFRPGMMAINFGTPNVATFVTEAKEDGTVETVKVDAKSLYREPMTYHATSGKVQSGVFLVPTNLPPEALERFKAAAAEMQGRQDITCVNTNCRVLQAAGFSIEGVAMDGVVFPNTLMEHLLFRNVFYTDSQGVRRKVHFEVINTTERNLEDFFEDVDTAVVGTRLRHARRHADTDEAKEARGAAAKALIEEEKARLAEAGSVGAVDDRYLGRRKVSVSVPSCFGNLCARVWGRHTIYELDLADKRADIAAAFAEGLKLRPFPQPRPSLGTRLKRDFFFARPMIRFLRRHMMGRVDTIHLYTQDIFRHLKAAKEGERFNYVLLDDKMVISRVHANGTDGGAIGGTADWALSKHALLSGREEVHCAGEIWYDKATDRFMMNGDSGTYTPTPERVRAVADLANRFFEADRFGNIFQAVEAEPAQVA